ncbi:MULTISPECIES: hypothetical protein [Raoultella]|uniref:hypothetical protein n=1 Tax=Raoultella sp. BIGb0149 TaxID=2485116 RepID=UPI001061A191|nr:MULTISPECIES: hypothetical protein [Raoultella]
MQNVIDFSALPVTFSSESESPVGVFGYGHPDGNAICRAPTMAPRLSHTLRPSYPGEIPLNTLCVRHQSDAPRQEKDVLPSMLLRFASTKR